ncbi:MAG: HlyD family efflux transporter periplasmic adaptor subunit [Bacteroidota bacterium]
MDRKIEKKGWSWQKLSLYAVGLAAIAFVLSAIYRDAGTSRLNVEKERLLIDTIHHGVFQEFIPVTGVIQPIKTVFLDAMEGGRVDEILIEDGSMVEKGQLILRLSNPDIQMSYLNQEAQIISQINQIRNLSVMMEQQSLNLKEQSLNVDFQLDLFSKRVARNKQLASEKIISEVEYEEQVDEYEHLQRRRQLLRATIAKDSISQILQRDQMDASLDLMQRNLTIAKQSLENLEIRAPISGQLSGLDKELGELIAQGESIAQMDVLDNFKVRAGIDEFYISRIFVGQEGSFTFAGQKYILTIKKIYPQVRNGTFEVDLVFKGNPPTAIKRGQTISIKLALSNKTEALLLARGSFYQSTGGKWVYIIDPDNNTAYKRQIEVGRLNPSFYEVVQGLKEGDIVITSSYENYNDKDELVLN